jgi:hypothetical protein
MNWMSVVFVAELGGIGAVEAAPAAPVVLAGAQQANTFVVGTTEAYIGWRAVYQFVSGFSSSTRIPTSIGGLIGWFVGRQTRDLIP